MVSTMEVTALDVEPAIKELAQGYDLTVRLHCILLAQKSEGRCPTLDLVEKILQAFKSSLAVLKPQTGSYTRFEVKESAAKTNNKNSFSVDNVEDPGEHSRKRKGINEKSYKTVTSTPHHDGYQWRKYGEKKIRGTMFPRCYYRCTYLHDQHCQAIKQIQQLNSDDPPLYEVTYNRKHTCTIRSSSKRNGEDPQNKDGFPPTCIIFGGGDSEDDNDDDVTIVSSTTTKTEVDPAQQRQPHQDSSKRPKIGALTIGTGPTQPGGSLSGPASRDDANIMDPAFMRRLKLNQQRESPIVMSPTPLSVVGPTPFSVVGPSQFSPTLTPVQPARMPPVQPAVMDRASLIRHMRNEVAKRTRNGEGPTSSERLDNKDNNVGGSFPPFSFLTTRLENIIAQNNNHNNSNNQSGGNSNNNRENLFTLPSERSRGGGSERDRMESGFTLSQMERTGNGVSNARVRRSLSDNGNQMEGISRMSLMERNLVSNNNRVERSLSQNQMEGVFALSSNRNAMNRRSAEQMEGVFPPSSLESSANTNLTRVSVERERRKQMERASRESMEKSSETNSSNHKENGANSNGARIKSVVNASAMERNSENKMESPLPLHDTKLDRPNHNPNPNPNNNPNHNPSKVERSPEPSLASPKMNGQDKNSSEKPSEMEGMLRLSSMERMMHNTNPKENRAENNKMESFLSLSSLKKSPNRKTQNPNEMDGMLSLSLTERSASSSSPKRNSTQKTNEMESILSLSPMEKNLANGEDTTQMENILRLSSNPQPISGLNRPSTSSPPPQEDENPKSQLEATVVELRNKLDKSKEEEISTKEKVSNLEAEISAIKAANEAWQKMMAEEASRRVAEAVCKLASSLHSSGGGVNLPECSRRTEILFPGAVDENEDESVAEVPSLLSQLDNINKND